MRAESPRFTLFSGPGALRAEYRVHDWSSTATGHPDAWPILLRNAVSMMLDSQFPMFVAWGPELTFLYNSPYIALLDSKHPDALGAPLKSVWPGLWNDVHPLIDKALSGEPTFGEDIPRVIRRDGHEQQSWFTLSYSPIRDSDGTVAGALCIISETTARVLLERRQALQLRLVDRLRGLNSSEEITAAASELLGLYLKVPHVFYTEIEESLGIFEIKRDWAAQGSRTLAGRIGRLEDFGKESLAILRSGMAFAVCDVQSDERTARFADAYAAFGVRSVLVLPLTREGRLIASLTLYDVVPHRWTQEDLKLAADIAERTWNAVDRVAADEALRQADRRKDEFLAMLAHELRNPLAPISAAAQFLKMGQLDTERIGKTSDIIARQVEHMTGLIDDLLDVSRVTRGLVSLNKEALDVKRVVSDAVEQAQPFIALRSHRFTLDIDPDSTLVHGDYKRLVQVLANLLNNAAKFTPDEGQLSLCMEASEDQVVITVADNGIGMTPELIRNVFRLFSQADRTSDRSQGGLGLGLALVKSLVELHGGKVVATSKGPGAGSEFKVWLPRLVERTAPTASEGDNPIMPAASGGLRLMVVDDNVDAAETLAMFLRSAGHQVTVTHESRGALARAERERFDAYLLDIGLADMDGNELARRLRAMPQAKKPLLVAITGYGKQFDRNTSIDSGFDHYFVKPADLTKIVEFLADIARSGKPFPPEVD